MDIIMGSRDRSSDKLDGEFHVPLSYGKGSNQNIWAACLKCGEPHYLKITTSGFACRKCNDYNGNIEECKKKFAEVEEELFKQLPAHIVTQEARDMVALRDTMNIKADLYAKGITRGSVGGDRFRRILKNKLKEYHVKSNHYKA